MTIIACNEQDYKVLLAWCVGNLQIIRGPGDLDNPNNPVNIQTSFGDLVNTIAKWIEKDSKIQFNDSKDKDRKTQSIRMTIAMFRHIRSGHDLKSFLSAMSVNNILQ